MPKLKLFLKHLQVAGTKEFDSLLRYPACFPLPLHCSFFLLTLPSLHLWLFSSPSFPCLHRPPPLYSFSCLPPLWSFLFSLPLSCIFSPLSPTQILSPHLCLPSLYYLSFKKILFKKDSFSIFFTLVQTFLNIRYPMGYFLWSQQGLQQNKWLIQSLLECQASEYRCGGISG